MTISNEFLKSWAENIAALGPISASKLLAAATTARDAGKDLNDSAVRKALIDAVRI